MAGQNGKVIKTESSGLNKIGLALLLDEKGTTGSGDWVPNQFTKNASVEVVLAGTTPTATTAIYGCNSIDQPPASYDGTKIGNDISNAGLVAITTPCRWIKAKLSAISGTNPTVTVKLHQQLY